VRNEDDPFVPPASEPTTFRSGRYTLDACVHEPTGPHRGAIVIAHPHPGHGGNRDQPVVVLATRRAVAAGLTVLRFDFRGVRKSEGVVDDQAGHVEDVRRACFVAGTWARDGELFGAGFSYGARQLLRALALDPPDRPDVKGVLLLAPPTQVPRTSFDFGNLILGRPLRTAAPDERSMRAMRTLPVPAEVLVGSHDVVARPEDLRAAFPPPTAPRVLDGLNHFFSRTIGASGPDASVLGPAIDEALQRLLDGT
jgi:alpha/beta superfamily hydrolase